MARFTVEADSLKDLLSALHELEAHLYPKSVSSVPISVVLEKKDPVPGLGLPAPVKRAPVSPDRCVGPSTTGVPGACEEKAKYPSTQTCHVHYVHMRKYGEMRPILPRGRRASKNYLVLAGPCTTCHRPTQKTKDGRIIHINENDVDPCRRMRAVVEVPNGA